MKSLASRLYEFMRCCNHWIYNSDVVKHSFSVYLNQCIICTNKIASLSSSLKIELKACRAASHPTRWPAQICKSPALSRIFLLKVLTTVRPTIPLITSAIRIGLTPGFLSKEISLHATSDPSFPQHLLKIIFLPWVLLHYKDLERLHLDIF